VISGLNPLGGDIVLQGRDLSSLLIQAGGGGNIIRIHDTPTRGTPGGLTTTISTGLGADRVTVDGTTGALALNVQDGADTVFVGSASADLDRIQGPVTISGGGGNDALTFNDSAATLNHNYALSVNEFDRGNLSGPTVPPVTFSSFETITLNAGAGTNSITVTSTAAGTNVVINGGVGPGEVIGVEAEQNAILGPVAVHFQSAANDLFEYLDINNPSPQTYTFTANTISRSGQAGVTYDGTAAIFLLEPAVGGNKTYVRSVAAGSLVRSFVSGGDQVIVGSLAPQMGGDLNGILGDVEVGDGDPNAQVALIVDDSGNMDTTPRQAVFFPVRDGDNLINVLGLTATSIAWDLSPTSSVKFLGGAANETFVMQPIAAETNVTIVGGTGVNTLDYSSYTTGVTVNLETGVATDLAGISEFRNVIGGSRDDTLTGSPLGSVLVGGAGNDVLTGGAGRNILIGGSGTDTLIGGNAGDILVGEQLSYYDEAAPTVDTVALDALFAEWCRTDLVYQDRVDHLSGSVAGGLNGLYVLNGTTVFDDGVVDDILAGAGQNWLLPS
jgi:hypothetical protein